MKITKFRVLSLIAILSCATAWTVGLRTRSSREHLVERTSNSENQSSDSFTASFDHSVQQASAILASSEGVVLLSSENDDAGRARGTNDNFDVPNTNNPTFQNRIPYPKVLPKVLHPKVLHPKVLHPMRMAGRRNASKSSIFAAA